MITRHKVLSVTFTAALIAGAGLGSTGVAMAAPGPVSQAVPAMTTGAMSISIDDFVFTGPGTVNPGGEITVTNNDTEAHTVTADDGSFDVTIPGGASATFTAPDAAGSYGFFCKFHGNMRGTLTVGAEAMAPAPTTPAPAPAPAPEVSESGNAGNDGMDQMGAVPKGGADTGVVKQNPSEVPIMLALGGGLVLAAAAGGTYAVRRRTNDN
ncbi:cupredoxin domain-containing protein [Arthrobacter sp. CAN_C5]|uniref:cupredoxin domain-containing protein n=1 Tax=Arthrobacter sp. CAN_C5 TaxID=2760706 RepID=UPI001AEA2D22|nr:cupredoxin domain-containing protein [Arthrobacter sp. CAN_C5]MBP2215031.1 plastocyanin [Arthrobacter sp. CAN_C5]